MDAGYGLKAIATILEIASIRSPDLAITASLFEELAKLYGEGKDVLGFLDAVAVGQYAYTPDDETP